MLFLIPRSLLAVAASLVCLLPAFAGAAGLGRLSVASALGQPLVAEIDVVSPSPGDLSTLSARLAPPDVYREAGVEYVGELTRLEFTVVPRGSGRAVIRVTSSVPITEPVLNLLIEATWASGRLQRRFALLLDPPGYGTQVAAGAPISGPVVVPPPASAQPAPVIPMARPAAPPAPAPALGVPVTPVAPPAAAAPAPPTAVAARPAAPRPPPAARPASRPSPAEGAPGTYGPVQRGESLGEIAQRVRPEGAALPQVIAALYIENPGAFVGENMNRLMAGSTLRVPTAEQVNAIPLADARKLAAAHAAGRRVSLAEAAGLPASRGDAASAEPGTARGRLSSAIDSARLSPPGAGTDTLKLSRGPDDRALAAGPSERAEAKREDLTAREQSIQDAKVRIAELQAQIRDVERLLTLASAGGAGSGPGSAIAGAGAPNATATAPPAAPPPAPQGAASPGSASGSGAAAAAPGPPPPAKARAPAPPPPEPSLLDELQGELFWVAALVVVTLGVGAIVLMRRRQRLAPMVAAAPALGPRAPRAKAPAAGAPPATPLPAEEPEFLAELDKGRPSPSAAEESDPVAEADSLITYGRYAQAEEVLRTALAADANRPQVALRLLELLHAKRDASGFEKVAHDLKASVGEASAVWRKAAALGKEIDAANRLYGGSGAGAMPSLPPAPAARALEGAAVAMQTPANPAPAAPPADMPALDFVAGILAEPPKATSLLEEPSAANPASKTGDGVGTRLDLAKAYLEIGDKEGAKDLLKEVIRSGSEAQRNEAEKLLASL